jgi:hypothetical protein
VPPEERVLPRFAAEPAQEGIPYGRWEERLCAEFLAGCEALEDKPEDLGEPSDVIFYPDRSWHGRTYVPATTLSSTGYELFGYIRFATAEQGAEPSDFYTHVDFTGETAEQNPQWRLDICDEVIGSWRGHVGAVAAMTLVWGRPLISGGKVVTAELANLAVDQCELFQERFTLLAPDDYRHDLLEIKLWGGKGQELASESLYEGDEEVDEEEES